MMTAIQLARIGEAVFVAAYWHGCEDRPHPSETMTMFKKRRRKYKLAQAEAARVDPATPIDRRALQGRMRAGGPSGCRRGADLPAVLMTWFNRGLASAVMVRAAERFISDYHAGFSRTVRGVRYAERVDGGGGSGDGEIPGLDARERHAAAMAAMGLSTAPAVKAWLVDGVSAGTAVSVSSGWKKDSSARAAAGGALLVGLDSLVKFYG